MGMFGSLPEAPGDSPLIAGAEIASHEGNADEDEQHGDVQRPDAPEPFIRKTGAGLGRRS